MDTFWKYFTLPIATTIIGGLIVGFVLKDKIQETRSQPPSVQKPPEPQSKQPSVADLGPPMARCDAGQPVPRGDDTLHFGFVAFEDSPTLQSIITESIRPFNSEVQQVCFW